MSIRRHVADRGLPPAVHAALDAGTVGALVCDVSRIYEANEHFLDLVGFTRAELEAGALSWLRMTAPQWLADDARAIGQLRSTRRADAYAKEFFHRDGSTVAVRLADLLLDLDPLRIFAFVARADDEAAGAIIDAVDAAGR
jgi:PAS domain S-box-containing protein